MLPARGAVQAVTNPVLVEHFDVLSSDHGVISLLFSAVRMPTLFLEQESQLGLELDND